MVQRTTICALGAQDRGSNPRRLSVPCLGNGDPTGLLRQPQRRVPGSTPGHGVMPRNVCPDCEEEAFRHVPLGETTSIDTIGSVRICVTDEGTYFHGTR